MRLTRILPLLAASVLLAGCPKPAEMPDGGETSSIPETRDDDRRASSGLDGGRTLSGSEFDSDRDMRDGGAGPEQTIVYFAYDRSDIRPEYNSMIAAHARYLAQNPGFVVRLEGHADERGSREYNIGLGERRAQAVRQALRLQGASSSQMSTVSYGEERPQALGSTEDAWSRNRRVEIVYVR